MDLQRLKFYGHRLTRSSVVEMRHRFSEYLFIRRLKADPDLYARDLDFELANTANNNLVFPEISSSGNTELIARLLNEKEFTLGEDPAVLHKFAKKWKGSLFTEVRQEKSDPDIRSVWEPARLQHLMILLQYLPRVGDTARHNSIQNDIQSRLFEWLSQNPFLHGPHYMSVMECGLRIPVFIQALQSLENLSNGERDKLLLTIFQYGWLIRKRLSLYSSIGNHTVSECVGLVMAGALFKQSIPGKEWLHTGISLLEQECFHQILADGGPAEQSFTYHRFVLDLYWLAIHFLTDNNLHDCSKIQQRITLGETFMQTIQRKNESLPMVGDSDDGFAVAPCLSPVRDIPPTDESPVFYKSFADSGYSLLRNKNGLRILFDHGVLGMEPLNNHGHADCLSIFVSAGDKDFFVDPGTFQYNGSSALRRYFKSTCAHNTVCIDGQDQARQLTGFVWDRSFEVSCKQKVDKTGKYVIVGTHNGYLLQNIAVKHERTLTFNPDSDTFTIIDSFSGSGVHEYTLHFHLHPRVTVTRKDDHLLLCHDDVCLALRINAGEIDIFRGQQSPICGWYSAAYGKKEATNTIRAIQNGVPNEVSFTTTVVVV